MKRDSIPLVTIRRAVNGYIVETTNPVHGPGITEDTVYVFQSLSALHEWLAENFAV